MKSRKSEIIIFIVAMNSILETFCANVVTLQKDIERAARWFFEEVGNTFYFIKGPLRQGEHTYKAVTVIPGPDHHKIFYTSLRMHEVTCRLVYVNVRLSVDGNRVELIEWPKKNLSVIKTFMLGEQEKDLSDLTKTITKTPALLDYKYKLIVDYEMDVVFSGKFLK